MGAHARRHFTHPLDKHMYRIPIRRTVTFIVWWSFATAVALGCASAGASKSSSKNDALILADEIENSHQPTLYDVVRAVRPMWLRPAPTAIQSGQDSGVSVYLDDQRAGGLDVLRQLPSSAAASIRYYSATEAQSRFGIGNLRGVIQIVSARGPRGQ
jgi:hypothetical protein